MGANLTVQEQHPKLLTKFKQKRNGCCRRKERVKELNLVSEVRHIPEVIVQIKAEEVSRIRQMKMEQDDLLL